MLFSMRESSKYYIVKLFDLCRRLVRQQGQRLHKAGVIETVQDVFNLSLEDLHLAHYAQAATDHLQHRRPSIGPPRRSSVREKNSMPDLRALQQKNASYWRQTSHVKRFPKLVDSRGREIKQRKPDPDSVKPSEVCGMAVSSGVARGRIKVLQTPFEKSLEPGEVLVTRMTDPGWTPLFPVCEAVILEVGGALQHGALVAREYGKPCVAGVDDCISRFVLTTPQQSYVCVTLVSPTFGHALP